MAAMQARAVAAVRRRDAAVEAEHGPGAVWVAVSHGDVIKAVLADALGMHLDLFQRHPRRPGVGVGRALHRRRGPSSGTSTPTAATCPGCSRRSRAQRGDGRPRGDAAVGGGAGPQAPTARS